MKYVTDCLSVCKSFVTGLRHNGRAGLKLIEDRPRFISSLFHVNRLVAHFGGDVVRMGNVEQGGADEETARQRTLLDSRPEPSRE